MVFQYTVYCLTESNGVVLHRNSAVSTHIFAAGHRLPCKEAVKGGIIMGKVCGFCISTAMGCKEQAVGRLKAVLFQLPCDDAGG